MHTHSVAQAVSVDSPAALKTLEIQQGLIARMSTASTSCKTWCITLISTLAVLTAERREPKFAVLALIPVVLFAALDIYYLALERRFRDTYEHFTDMLRWNTATQADLLVAGGTNLTWQDTVKSICSKSIWSFYTLIVLALLVTAVIAQ